MNIDRRREKKLKRKEKDRQRGGQNYLVDLSGRVCLQPDDPITREKTCDYTTDCTTITNY